MNPLNSADALKSIANLNKEQSPLKSLFDFKENKHLKKSEAFVPTAPLPKTSFSFKTDLFKVPSDLYKPVGLPVLTDFTNKQSSFKLTLPTNPFSSENNLFRTNTNNPWQTEKKDSEEVKQDGEEAEEEEEKLEPEVKEKVQASKDSQKLYQKAIRKLHLEKGIASGESKPAKKRDGFLSIESMKTASEKTIHCVVFRSFQGFTHFSAVVNKQLAKRVEHVDSAKPGQHQVRVYFYVKNPVANEMQRESVVISFLNSADKDDFLKAYEQAANA